MGSFKINRKVTWWTATSCLKQIRLAHPDARVRGWRDKEIDRELRRNWISPGMKLRTDIELTIVDSPRLRAAQAQERDDIATVNMEILAFRRRIAAQIGIGRAEPSTEVVNVAQQMPLRVLRAGAAEISADAPIGRRALCDRPLFDRHAAE